MAIRNNDMRIIWKLRITWKSTYDSVRNDVKAMNKVQNGEITVEEGCKMIVDINDRHPSVKQLLWNMKFLGYSIRNVKYDKD